MLNIPDKRFFIEIVADAVAETFLTCSRKSLRERWIRTIAKAAAVILEGDTDFLHWNPQEKILCFWSPDSNEIYDIGTHCQCPAFDQQRPKPCYHRAMSRLVYNYFEFQAKPGELAKIDFADGVLFDPDLSVKEKIDLLNLSILEGRTELQPRVTALKKHLHPLTKVS